jgi:hypothetical protein
MRRTEPEEGIQHNLQDVEAGERQGEQRVIPQSTPAETDTCHGFPAGKPAKHDQDGQAGIGQQLRHARDDDIQWARDR